VVAVAMPKLSMHGKTTRSVRKHSMDPRKNAAPSAGGV